MFTSITLLVSYFSTSMQSLAFALFLLTSIVVVVKSQVWTGNYTTDSACNRTSCCCLNGQILITNASNTVSIAANLSSVCNGLTILAANITNPTSFSNTFTVANQTFLLILSTNSLTITSNPLNGTCTGNATKTVTSTATDMALTKMMMMRALVLACIGMILSKI